MTLKSFLECVLPMHKGTKGKQSEQTKLSLIDSKILFLQFDTKLFIQEISTEGIHEFMYSCFGKKEMH